MKILLIQPPFTVFRNETKKCHPPLGLAYLAAALKTDHEVRVIDALAEGFDKEEIIDKEFMIYGLTFNDIKKKIAEFMPDAVGISCLFSSQAENVHKICKISKGIDKKIVTILGGAHPSSVPVEVLRDDSVDFVVIGEGENTIRSLLERLEAKKDFKDIEGIGFKDNGEIKINQKRGYLEDLDSLPFPLWDIFPLEKYYKINNPHGSPAKRIPFMPIITSRGCPFECVFCSIHNIWGRKYRKRSAENILLEIEYLIKRFEVKEILFEDDNLTLDKERARKIFQGIIDRGFDISWSVPNGVAVQTLDFDMLSLMKRSGCYAISLAIESGDEYVLKEIIKKPIELSQIKPIVDKANQLRLDTSAFFVVGLPGEKREHLKHTLSFAEKLNVDNINFFFATPLPGTKLLELCKEKDLMDKNIIFSNLTSYYPSFSTEDFSKAELWDIIQRERIKLYFLFLLRNPKKFIVKFYNKLLNDPGYILRLVKKIFSTKKDI